MQLTPIHFTANRRSGRRPVVHPGGATLDDVRVSEARVRGYGPAYTWLPRQPAAELPEDFVPPAQAARDRVAAVREARERQQEAFDQGRLFLPDGE